MKSPILCALVAAALLVRVPAAGDTAWPRSYTVDGAEVVLYEPRIEQWQGSSLQARVAAGIRLPGGNGPLYGSFTVHADALTQPEARTVSLFNFTANDFKLPDAPDKLGEFTRLIQALAPEKPVKVPLDALLAAVPSDDVITPTTVTTPTQTKAPKVIVRFDHTVLVAFDGKPQFRAIPGTGLEAAVNTPATLLRPENGGSLYLLTNEGLWLQAPGWAGPWSAATHVPPGLDRIPPDHPVAQAIKNTWPPTGAVVSVPEVVTSESPTELIQLEGKPKYDRIAGLPLMRVSNTDSRLFYHFDQSLFYVLISGRWFASAELAGPWTYVPHNELPGDFAEIPADDAAADVRASIAGTREAEEAAKEAQIPTLARVDLREAPSLTVDYDGEPVFEAVPGLPLSYAVNTTDAVIFAGGLYYCCRDGIWFVANAAFGSPWRCATVLPREILLLPPSCPLYHTRFCVIDSFSDSYVVYGCTPGYWGTYVDPYSHVCVYGTGWWYAPYVSRDYYCGHSWTYGFGCRYVPRHGFVRECDRVAHTSWFRHAGRGATVCRADSDRWGGRYESTHWRASSGRGVAFSTWNTRATTHVEDVAGALRHRGDIRHDVAQKSGPKPKVESRGFTPAPALGLFEKDVRAGHQGEVYRRGTDGWLRRDSGQWTVTDSKHPVDPRVVESSKSRDAKRNGKPPVASVNREGFTRQGHGTQNPTQTFTLEKGRAPLETRDRPFEIRSAQPAHVTEGQGRTAIVPQRDEPPAKRTRTETIPESSRARVDQPPMTNRFNRDAVTETPRVERREMPKAERHEPVPQVQIPQRQIETPRVERRETPKVERREPVPQVQIPQRQIETSRVERRETPKVERRESTPQVQVPQRQIERREMPPQVQHLERRETPRVVERHDPPPQIRREEPRRMEQPQPKQESGSRESKSRRGDDKKDDKKR